MAFAPDKTFSNSYKVGTIARPRSAVPSSDVYGVKNIAKTPSAAELAFNVMKKIHRAAGEECPDRGRSVYDNLAYMKTEPTVQLLANKTWRDFFMEYEQHEDKQERERVKPESEPAHHLNQQESTEINYTKLFHKLVKRTYSLWKELHFPDADRDFYTYALLQGPFRSPEQIDELASYVKRLKDHRDSTILVLSYIHERERCVVRCTELIASAHRSMGMKFVSMQEEHKKKMDSGGGDTEDSVAEDIRDGLNALRSASTAVVKAVQAWRRELWRPHPFV